MAMSQRCVRISKSGIRAIKKLCRQISFYTLDAQEPTDDYERLYNENKVVENVAMILNCLYTQNPSEDVFKDNQLKAQGDAVIMGMTMELEQLGIIGDSTDDYNKIPSKIMACHVKVDELKYTILQCSLMSFLEGYPLQYSMSLKLDENNNKVKVADANEG